MKGCVLVFLAVATHLNNALVYQRYDGWYNNLANPEWGSIGDEVMYKAMPAYSDLTYLPAGSKRPNPREISNRVFTGETGQPSFMNRTALFGYFGQMISAEIVSASESTCPVELIKIPIPVDDIDYSPNVSGENFIPFTRSAYSRSSGQSPNHPRQPINRVTSWIDGSFIYGQGQVWTSCMRAFKHGKLATDSTNPSYPAKNKMGLPLKNNQYYGHGQEKKMEELWMFGDAHSHQNPGLTAIALLWFRYHNRLADEIRENNRHFNDEQVFTHTRHWVIATLQSIVAYEWLPTLLGHELPVYSGYKNSIRPSISAAFEATAFRSLHSYMSPAIYIRNKQCVFDTSLRLCNVYFRSQEILSKVGAENIILGLASQLGEQEDHVVISDLRGKSFGPRHFSRQDLVTMTIMRGRDHGLPNYNSMRKAYGLPEISNFSEINSRLQGKDAKVLQDLYDVYGGDTELLDVYPTGMLEFTDEGPGPLFSTIIEEQFIRLRDADRFWFENPLFEFFTEENRTFLRNNVTMKYVIQKAMGFDDDDLQDNVFVWKDGDPCEQPYQARENDMEECTPPEPFDYFNGSEASYIAAFTCLGLVPFACILVAVVIARFKKWKMKRQQMNRRHDTIRSRRTSVDITGYVHAYEWLGRKQPVREVDVGIHNKLDKLVLLVNNKEVRSVEFSRQDAIAVWVDGKKKKTTMLVHVPKEYDLVLVTDDEEEMQGLLDSLKRLSEAANKPLHRHDCTAAYIYENANTKIKRQELLTKFFRSVFAEAYNVKEIQPTDELQINQCKEIVSCELSRGEFAEALALKPDSLFVNQMFSIIDRDQNGYVSFRELLYAVLLFTKGSCEDKMRLLFTMYDVDKSGTLSKDEVTQMIKSMMDIANADLSPNQLDGLVSKMFAQAGAKRRLSLKFEDFSEVMADRLDMIWDVCLDFKGTKICMPKPKRSASVETIQRKPSRTGLASNNITERTSGHPSRPAIFLKDTRHYIENHRQHIFYLLLYCSICVAVFAERFYYYDVETEHMGYRSLAGSGVAITRGAAAGISFTFSLLLLTMCRNTITVLRGTFINLYVPFDSHVTFHKLVAYTALFFSVFHIVGYCFNFYHIATQPVEYLCVFNEVYLRQDFLPKVHYWLFGNVIGMTGVLLVVCLAIIYVFATQTSRTHIFNAFWITHKLIYLLYFLIILHGSSRIIQDPQFWYYFIAPASIFLVDKMISLARQKREISVIDSELLPSDVTRLEFKRPHNFEYLSGQWVRLAVAPLGREEYHSFTLTSAPNEDTLSLHVRAVGPWTHNIRNVFDPAKLSNQPFPTAFIDGPYGAGQQDWFKYEVSVLVGGGIGVTPYASILKDFVHMTSIKNTFRVKCQKLYFVWVTASQKHFEWFIDILKCVEEMDVKSIVETHIFITRLFHEFDLRTTMLYLCEEHFQKMSGKSMFTGLAATTHFGRPNFENILEAVREKHPRVRKVGVFSCGPPGLTKGVQKACYSVSTQSKTRFEHHFENF